jgi:hypothetical protein
MKASLRTVLALTTSILVIGILAVPQAKASVDQNGIATSKGEFVCSLNYFPWPSPVPWGAADCVGTFIGVVDRTVCLPNCDFRMTVTHSEICVGNLPAATVLEGDMFVRPPAGPEIYLADYVWQGVGVVAHSGPFILPGHVRGSATQIPNPPFPTCTVPGGMSATLIGDIATVPPPTR